MQLTGRLKNLAYALALTALCTLHIGQAQAGLVSTDTVFRNAEIIAPTRAEMASMLDTQAVAEQLIALGADPATVKQRVANLTDAELLGLQNNLETLPAGGIDALAAALIVFLVLLATDIAGYTDIFPFVKKQ